MHSNDWATSEKGYTEALAAQALRRSVETYFHSTCIDKKKGLWDSPARMCYKYTPTFCNCLERNWHLLINPTHSQPKWVPKADFLIKTKCNKTNKHITHQNPTNQKKKNNNKNPPQSQNNNNKTTKNTQSKQIKPPKQWQNQEKITFIFPCESCWRNYIPMFSNGTYNLSILLLHALTT